jgi:hypothetical protein
MAFGLEWLQSIMSNSVEELFAKTIPEEVWHYTTLAGLDGILSSGTMWATDARFTNDTTEFIHARVIAAEYLKSLKSDDLRASMPLDTISSMLDKAFDGGALSPTETEVYLISFSEAPDLLSQWNSYADSSRGVSIAFDLRYIRPPKEEEIAVTFAPCVYGHAEKLALIDDALSHFVSGVARLDRQAQDQDWMKYHIRDWQLMQDIYGLPFDKSAFGEKLQCKFKVELLEAWRKTLFDLLRVASHCKSAAFSAEREWRLALARPANRARAVNPVQLRGMKGNIPYFRSNLFRSDRLPVTRVMTGPLCTETDKVQKTLESNGYAVPLVNSSAPLRDTRTM